MIEAILEKSVSAERSEAPASPRRVCFICTGNTCRSPMAAAVANALAAKASEALPESVRDCFVPPIEAFSAGLYTNENDPITENAVMALERAGIPAVKGKDYHLHTAHTLTAEEAEHFDLLIGMTGGHTFELLMRFPQAAKKMIKMPREISDPFGGNQEVYDRCLTEIIAGVRELFFSVPQEKPE